MTKDRNHGNADGKYPFDDERLRLLWEQSWDGSLHFRDNVTGDKYELRIQKSPVASTLFRNEEPICTSADYALRILLLLMVTRLSSERGSGLTTNQIYAATWGLAKFKDRTESQIKNRVDQEIVVLREKLGDQPKKTPQKQGSRIVATIRGYGFSFLLDVEWLDLGRGEAPVSQSRVVTAPESPGPSNDKIPSHEETINIISAPRDEVLLHAFEGTLHLYHLSETDERQPAWWYKSVNLRLDELGKTLSGRTFSLPRRGAPKEKKHEYEYEVSVDWSHLVVWARCTDGTPDVSVAVFPDARTLFPISGMFIITKTWANNPASSICIVSDTKLVCASDAIDGEPISDPDQLITRELEAVWKDHASTFLRLPLVSASATRAETETILPRWDMTLFDKFLDDVTRMEDGEGEAEDLRILSTFFINETHMRSKLKQLLAKGVRVKVLFMDPTKWN